MQMLHAVAAIPVAHQTFPAVRLGAHHARLIGVVHLPGFPAWWIAVLACTERDRATYASCILGISSTRDSKRLIHFGLRVIGGRKLGRRAAQ